MTKRQLKELQEVRRTALPKQNPLIIVVKDASQKIPDGYFVTEARS